MFLFTKITHLFLKCDGSIVYSNDALLNVVAIFALMVIFIIDLVYCKTINTKILHANAYITISIHDLQSFCFYNIIRIFLMKYYKIAP